VYRDRLSTPAGFVVGFAHVALPYLHVPDLSWRSGFEVFLDDVSSDEVELQVALWTFQEFDAQFL
jgi:hypothetical protein